jgi:hypothetical protein
MNIYEKLQQPVSAVLQNEPRKFLRHLRLITLIIRLGMTLVVSVDAAIHARSASPNLNEH